MGLFEKELRAKLTQVVKAKLKQNPSYWPTKNVEFIVDNMLKNYASQVSNSICSEHGIFGLTKI